MDVIINNPATSALLQTQYAPVSQTPYGYPGYDGYQGHHFHGGPGFVLPLLLLGGFLFLRGRGKRRRQMMGRSQMQNGQMQNSQTQNSQTQNSQTQGSAMPGNFMDDIRENFRRGRQQFVTDSALDIARERYARGEITAEEYQTILKTLGAQPGGNQPPPTTATTATIV
ncbi:SHOCT domain-containing protein [Deinococcus sp.]|uniref:SHOCT domain-containing protein n=1 Tax=Deinococcus sp. TaxID=47478 RepID=UPI0025CF0D53|nr:SHOCT domain-containing protein [Deinococcus sp.]